MRTLLFLLAVIVGSAQDEGSDLATIRGLYASAAFEDVLAHIETLTPERISPPVEQYRALCLFALDRHIDGEAAFERLVRQSPDFLIPDGEIAPRLHTVFRDVRRRVLPEIARGAYDRGVAHLDAGRFDEASVELRRAQRWLHDPDVQGESARTADLGKLIEGFLRLAEASATADAPATNSSSPVDVSDLTDVPAGRATDASADPIYSAFDADVTPPVEVQRPMPGWDPPAVMARYLEYHGEIAVVVDQTGRVTDAEITRETIPSYDRRLLDRVPSWRFEPARRDGAPVRYRLAFQVVLAPIR